MSNIPINVCGTVATVPNTRTLPTGRACASFRLAVNHWRVNKETGEFVPDSTSWFGVDCYGPLASNVGTSVFQGMSVVVQGNLRIREWLTEERSGIAPTIIADHLGPDLRFGTAHYQKANGSHTAKPPAAPEAPEGAWGGLSTGSAERGPDTLTPVEPDDSAETGDADGYGAGASDSGANDSSTEASIVVGMTDGQARADGPGASGSNGERHEPSGPSAGTGGDEEEKESEDDIATATAAAAAPF